MVIVPPLWKFAPPMVIAVPHPRSRWWSNRRDQGVHNWKELENANVIHLKFIGQAREDAVVLGLLT